VPGNATAVLPKTISPPDIDPEKFDPTQMIYGVDCEKCHGPGAEHVAFQAKNPGIPAKYIINPAHLSRQQNMDLCSSCHGGRLFKSRPSFEFTVGDTLANFFDLDKVARDPLTIDVHGNQNGLLRASACFRMSENAYLQFLP
jgi:mono/diheme cytochrome c family protein